MSDVFISYVRQDERFVQFLCEILRLNGVKVWLDKEKLSPGVRWKSAIEDAVRSGMFFLSIYSHARQSRCESYVNEETVVAVEEIRRRPQNKAWFIPVIINDCEVERRPIGGGEYIDDLQFCDLRDWNTGLFQLLKVLGVDNPIIDNKKPLSDGIPSFVKVSSGFVRYEEIQGAPPIWQGLEHRVETGWCHRNSYGTIVAYLELRAPVKALAEFNTMLGYNGFHSECFDEALSQSSDTPSRFTFLRDLMIPAGTEIPVLQTGKFVKTEIDLPLRSQFIADGTIAGMNFVGSFQGIVTSLLPQIPFTQISSGIFELHFTPDNRPPELS